MPFIIYLLTEEEEKNNNIGSGSFNFYVSMWISQPGLVSILFLNLNNKLIGSLKNKWYIEPTDLTTKCMWDFSWKSHELWKIC